MLVCGETAVADIWWAEVNQQTCVCTHMCVCVCVYIYIYIYVYIYVYTHTVDVRTCYSTAIRVQRTSKQQR